MLSCSARRAGHNARTNAAGLKKAARAVRHTDSRSLGVGVTIVRQLCTASTPIL